MKTRVISLTMGIFLFLGISLLYGNGAQELLENEKRTEKFNTLLGIKEGEEYIDVHFKVTDDSGMPIEAAKVMAIYRNLNEPSEDVTIAELTDARGTASIIVRAGLSTTVWCEKEGFYSYGYRPASRGRISWKDLYDEMEYKITLRRICNPIPLYVKNNLGEYSKPYTIPERGKWFGFDLKVGDWVRPYGIGIHTDLQFRHYYELVKKPHENDKSISHISSEVPSTEVCSEHIRDIVVSAMYNNVLEVSFKGLNEGISIISDKFIPQCILPMPHKAPVENYVMSLKIDEFSINGDSSNYASIGYYLRTRVNVDDEGNIIAANYSKIYGNIKFSPNGDIRFYYFFNPSINDRNLEFDNGCNLFLEDTYSTRSLARP